MVFLQSNENLPCGIKIQNLTYKIRVKLTYKIKGCKIQNLTYKI